MEKKIKITCQKILKLLTLAQFRHEFCMSRGIIQKSRSHDFACFPKFIVKWM